MENKNEIINNNLVKVIGLAVLMAFMVIAYFSGSEEPKTIFGLPVDQIEKIDSTN